MRQAEVAVKRGNFFLKLGEAFRIRAYLVTYVQGQRTRNEFSHLFHVFFLHNFASWSAPIRKETVKESAPAAHPPEWSPSSPGFFPPRAPAAAGAAP